MPALDLATALDAVRDILEGLVYLGTPIGTVMVRPVKVISKATYERVFTDQNESQTIWVLTWEGADTVWPDTPGATIERNYLLKVDGYRPRIDTEAATFDFLSMTDYVHRQLSRPSNVQLGLEHSLVAGIRVGPWSCENRGFDSVGGVECFRCTFQGQLLNAVEEVT